MNLYIIKRPGDPGSIDYGEWIAAVVIAESEDAARLIHPSGDDFYDATPANPRTGYPARPVWHERTGHEPFGGWIAPADVVVEFLAEASPSQRAGVVLGANSGD